MLAVIVQEILKIAADYIGPKRVATLKNSLFSWQLRACEVAAVLAGSSEPDLQSKRKLTCLKREKTGRDESLLQFAPGTEGDATAGGPIQRG